MVSKSRISLSNSSGVEHCKQKSLTFTPLSTGYSSFWHLGKVRTNRGRFQFFSYEYSNMTLAAQPGSLHQPSEPSRTAASDTRQELSCCPGD